LYGQSYNEISLIIC
jgi:ribosomal protein L36